MKVISVVGARPQFVKLAPVADAFAATDHHHLVAHTGQHYDREMSEVFFGGLAIPDPDWNLAVGSGPHGQQTGQMLEGLESLFKDDRPDWVLVYGDTNSTLAGALAAVKLQLRVAHLEAGLRSFNRAMPEEHNRVLTDHAADLLLAPTAAAGDQLEREGLADRTVVVGDVMTDVLYHTRERNAAHPPTLPVSCDPPDGYLVSTIHRAENTDDPSRLEAIVAALAELSQPVVFLAHPRTRDRAAVAGIALERGAVRVEQPLGYAEMVAAISRCAGVITDSGGLQKEAFLLGVPCTTVRTETEWTETLDAGWNVLTPEPADIATAVSRPRPAPTHATPYGDGHAAEQVVAALEARL